MTMQISKTIMQRLERLAQERGSDVETLLTHLLDQEENRRVPDISVYAQRLMEVSSALIAVTDTKGRFVYVNPAFCQTLGFEARELIGKSSMALVHPEDHDLVWQPGDVRLRDDLLDQYTLRYYCKDGTYKWLSWIVAQDYHQFYLIAYDVTQQKKLEERLEWQAQKMRESQSRLKGIVDSQIDFVYRYLPDTTLTFANDAYCEYFGKTHQELIGRSFLPQGLPEQYNEIFIRIEELKRDPSPGVRTFKNIMSDGRERWIQWVDFGILDEDGRLVEIQAVGRDITELKVAEQAVKVQNEVLQTILDHMPIMLMLLDVDGTFLLVNQYWVDVLGWTVEEMNAHPDIMAAFYPDAAYRQEAMEYMQSLQPGWRDFQTVSKSGDIIESTWANVRLPDGRTIGIGQDIRLRKMYEEQALYARQLEVEIIKEQEIVQLRDRLITTVSHEFRTPLTIILSSAEIINRYWGRLSEEHAKSKLEGIMQQVNHMVTMLDDVLRISRVQSGYQAIHIAEFDAKLFLQGVVDKMRLIDQGQHEIYLDMQSKDQRINGDQQLLENVFTNLISNAIKYSPPGTQIRLRGHQDKHWWHFCVSDQGMGIMEDDKPYLFDPFFRGQNAHNTIGTGLGLSIVRQYVEMHEGQISIESQETAGATFCIKLPRQLQRDPRRALVGEAN